jgi:hypothetical protein
MLCVGQRVIESVTRVKHTRVCMFDCALGKRAQTAQRPVCVHAHTDLVPQPPGRTHLLQQEGPERVWVAARAHEPPQRGQPRVVWPAHQPRRHQRLLVRLGLRARVRALTCVGCARARCALRDWKRESMCVAHIVWAAIVQAHTHTHTRTHTRTHTHAHTHTRTQAHTHTHTHAHTHARTHACTHTHTHTDTCGV